MHNNLIFPDVNGIGKEPFLDSATSTSKESKGTEFFALLQSKQNTPETESTEKSLNPLNQSNSVLGNGWNFASPTHLMNLRRLDGGVQTNKIEQSSKSSNKANEALNAKPCKKQEAKPKDKEDITLKSNENNSEAKETVENTEESTMKFVAMEENEMDWCPEEVESISLEDFIKELSDEDLANLMETEEEFQVKLQGLIEEIENPEIKEQILAMLKENDGKALFDELKDMVISEGLDIRDQVQTVEIDTETDEDMTNTDKKSKLQLKAKTEQKTQDETEEVSQEEEVSLATSHEKMEVTEDSHRKEKFQEKGNTNKSEKGVELKETLRQEFARIHKTDAPEGAEVVEEGQKFNFDMDEMAINELFEGLQAPVQSLPDAGELVNKLMEKAFEQLQNLNNKLGKNHVEEGSLDANRGRTVLAAGSSGGNQGSSMGNSDGFSFQSGFGKGFGYEMGKGQPAGSTGTTNFAQMMQKAELVKTKDGMKVLNIEVDQDEMGKLEMELKSKDGVVTARLSAENELVKAELEKLTPQIHERLMTQGIVLESINVDVSSRNSDHKRDNERIDSVTGRSKLSMGAGASFEELIEGTRLDVLNDLRRAALNIQYIDEIV